MTFSSIVPLFGDREINEFRGEHYFLSNFYKSEIIFENLKYPSVENAYVAAKTLDLFERRKISNMNPGQAKKYGRNVKIREDWEDIKLDIMETLLRQKFSSISLKEKLLNTKESNLIEGNWWGDKFWGIDLETGLGKNNLGKILMKIRKEFQEVVN